MTPEKIKQIAAKCRTQWETHFGRYYGEGQEGKKLADIVAGIDSLVEDLIEELEQKSISTFVSTLGHVSHTERGFEEIRFKDLYGFPCSIQQSSLCLEDSNNEPERPGSSAIWVGCADNRMHLGKEQVQALIEHLQSWLKNGSFEAEENPSKEGEKDQEKEWGVVGEFSCGLCGEGGVNLRPWDYLEISGIKSLWVCASCVCHRGQELASVTKYLPGNSSEHPIKQPREQHGN